MLGLFTGVLAFDALLPQLVEIGVRSFPQSMTLPLLLGLPYGALAIVFGVGVLLMMAVADRLDPAGRLEKRIVEKPGANRSSWEMVLRKEWGWIPSGVLAGLIILGSSAQGQYFGISGGLAALTAHIADLFGSSLQSVPVLNETTQWRAAMVVGLFPGSFVSALLSRSFKPVTVTPLWDAAFTTGVAGRGITVFVGGFLIALGALIGGGCTTGAFMSGFPTLSVGNFVMGMTFFAVAMATAFVLYWGKWRVLMELRRAKKLDLATD